MITVIKLVICAAVGYLTGSLSSAVLVSRFIEKKDIRSMGSGNAGATNMTRVFGWGAGAVTFLCDVAKTVIAMLIGRLLGGDMGYLIGGCACLIGHCFPVFFGFRGGKGIAVGATVCLLSRPILFLVLLLAFVIGVALTRRVSVGSIAGSVLLPIAAYVLGEREMYRLICFLFIALLVIFMHRSNIVRLIKGTEPVFKAGSKKR